MRYTSTMSAATFGLRVAPIALVALLSLSACTRHTDESAAPAALTKLETQRQRASYVAGLDAARTLAPVRDEVDIEVVIQALRTAYAGQPPLLDTAAADTARREFTAHLRDVRAAKLKELGDKNLAEETRFLAENGKRTGVTTTESGLQYEVLREGTGAGIKPTDTVKMDYRSKVLNGEPLEDTYTSGHAAIIAFNQVTMPGWQEAMRIMKTGGKYQFWVPSKLGYGVNGSGNIEPNALLVLEAELLEIAKPGEKLDND